MLSISLEPPAYHFYHSFPIDGLGIVQDQYFLLCLSGLSILLLGVEPELVLGVDALQVIQRDGVLSLPRTSLDALLTGLGVALDVDDSGQVDDLVHGEEVVVELQIDCVFGLVQDIHITHDGCEDEPVREERPLRDA